MFRAAAATFVIAYALLAPGFVPSADAQNLASTSQSNLYFPEKGEWLTKRPQDIGMDPAQLAEAVKTAVESETRATKNMALYLATTFGAREPLDTPIGPVKDRGAANGLIIKNGYIVAEWGDTKRVDMTFSVAKTFLTTTVGLAWQKGLIRNVNDYARDYMPAGVDLFTAEHNRTIKWDYMLRQTSDWQGTLWGKPDWADRPEGANAADWPNRKLYEPGTRYKYNDVRMNVLALAALHVWRKPLPDVLRDEIMRPIGASDTWRWYGYENSWVDIDGKRMQSISGGGHWGGGMQIDAYDMARFGYLFLRDGKWKDRPLVSKEWIAMAKTPGTANPYYGFANWYLNTERRPMPAAPASAFWFLGNGNNIIYVDQENDIVAVVRWIDSLDSMNDVVAKILAAVKTPARNASAQ